jgi:hypothetical protein
MLAEHHPQNLVDKNTFVLSPLNIYIFKYIIGIFKAYLGDDPQQVFVIALRCSNVALPSAGGLFSFDSGAHPQSRIAQMRVDLHRVLM